ncbi:MAG: hypothetical protein ACK4GN_14915 [Runella sp.]
MNTWQYIGSLSDASILLPCIYLLHRFKYISGINKIIVFFIFITLARNIAAVSLEVARELCQCPLYNLFFYNWHNLLSFSCLSWIFFEFFKEKFYQWGLVLANVSVYAVALLEPDTILHLNAKEFSDVAFMLSRVYSIVLFLLFFYRLLQQLTVPILTRYPLFWFSAGGLLYYAGTLFPYLFLKYTFHNSNVELAQQYWMIEAFLSMVFSVFLALSVWYMKPSDDTVQ